MAFACQFWRLSCIVHYTPHKLHANQNKPFVICLRLLTILHFSLCMHFQLKTIIRKFWHKQRHFLISFVVLYSLTTEWALFFEIAGPQISCYRTSFLVYIPTFSSRRFWVDVITSAVNVTFKAWNSWYFLVPIWADFIAGIKSFFQV